MYPASVSGDEEHQLVVVLREMLPLIQPELSSSMKFFIYSEMKTRRKVV